MSEPARRWLLAGAAALFGMCLCGAVVAGGFVLSRLPWEVLLATTLPEQAAASTPAPATLPPTETASPAASASPAPAPTGLSPEVRSQMEAIEGQVVDLRGLHPTGPVDRELLTPDQLHERVLNDFLADYSEEEARDDARAFSLLALLNPDFDLLGLYRELYSEQVAGFYDDEEKAMYVVGGGFGGPERLTYAHEFDHALQDQTFDLRHGLGLNDAACESDSERCAGLQALTEGDATLLEEQWLQTFATQQDVDEILAFYQTFESPVFTRAPAFLQTDFLFPYESGLAFVQRLYLKGGWAAVDAAYGDPPASTEQILHPERYPQDKPVKLEAPDLLGAFDPGWEEIHRGTLGELDTRNMLAVYLDAETAAGAAEGWGGDFYLAFYNEASAEGALVMVTVWDTIRDTQDFALAFRDYGDARFGPHISTASGYSWEADGVGVLFERVSDQTLWILASDLAAAERLRAALTFPAPGP